MESIINGFPNYIITDDGRVFSLNYLGISGNKKELSLRHRNDGYINVCLSKNNKKYMRFIHRLVAEAFIPNPYNFPQVNHKDGDKSNNNISNLEWCTQSDNIKHSYSSGIRIDNKEHLNKICKLAIDKMSIGVCKIDNNGNIIETYKSATEASKITGCCRSKITACCKGQRNMTGGWRWKYKEI